MYGVGMIGEAALGGGCPVPPDGPAFGWVGSSVSGLSHFLRPPWIKTARSGSSARRLQYCAHAKLIWKSEQPRPISEAVASRIELCHLSAVRLVSSSAYNSSSLRDFRESGPSFCCAPGAVVAPARVAN